MDLKNIAPLHAKKQELSKRVFKLFDEDKLLARAMGTPRYTKAFNRKYGYDFSTWAKEFDLAKNEALTSASSTLLVKNQAVPTYKTVGVLLDGEIAKIEHISEHDSVSSGNSRDNDFHAFGKSLSSLSELAKLTREKQSKVMNEVNITVKKDAFLGLFAVKAFSQITEAYALLAQKHFLLQEGIFLPVFMYDVEKGTLQELNYIQEQSNSIINSFLNTNENGKVNIFYDLYSKHTDISVFFDGKNKTFEDEKQLEK